MTPEEIAQLQRAHESAIANLILAVTYAVIATVLAIALVLEDRAQDQHCTETRTTYTVKGPMQTCIAWRLK